MAKKKLIYSKDIQPRTITEIGKEFIQDYITANYKDGTITQEELDKWIAKTEKIEASKDTPMKKFSAIRGEFVNLYYPQLKKKDSKYTMSQYLKALKK